MDDFPLDIAYPDLFDDEEAALLSRAQLPPQRFRPRKRIVRAGDLLNQSAYLVDGFLCRYASDRLGRRQIVGLQIPGDYTDLPAYALGQLEHDIDSLGPAVIRMTPHAELDRIEHQRPMLSRKLWRISLIDAAIHRYWIFRLGRLSGHTRLANFFCEMFLRLYARGMAEPGGYPLPLTQADLAEIVGLSSVHVNRLLGGLRNDGICTLQDGRVEIYDLGKMFRVGEFTRDYLYLPESVERRVAALLR